MRRDGLPVTFKRCLIAGHARDWVRVAENKTDIRWGEPAVGFWCFVFGVSAAGRLSSLFSVFSESSR
jgi:hypothetical protein